MTKVGRDCVHLGWPAESPTFLSYCCYCLPARTSCLPTLHTLQLFSSGSQVSSSAGRVCRSSKSPSQNTPHLWRAAGSCNRCHTGRRPATKYAHRSIRWKPLEAVKERQRQPLVPGTHDTTTNADTGRGTAREMQQLFDTCTDHRFQTP